jgi:hypothetical protein
MKKKNNCVFFLYGFNCYLVFFYYNVFQLPKRTPPTPVQACRAHWVGVRIHVILLGIVMYVICGYYTVIVDIQE